MDAMDGIYDRLDDELSGENKDFEDKYALIQSDFRSVFSTEQGKRVLNVILNDLHYFQPCCGERETALRNYATCLVEERMGFNNTISFVENLLKCEHE